MLCRSCMANRYRWKVPIGSEALCETRHEDKTMRDDVDALRSELADRIVSHALTKGDHQTLVPGLFLTRLTEETACYRATCQPSLTLFGQGRKRIELGGVEYLCDRSSFFLSSISMPIQSQVPETSSPKP